MEENKNKEQHEFDLPLSSNFHDVKVEHFILDLTCNLKENIFHGALTVFCKRRINHSEILSEIKDGICDDMNGSDEEQRNEIKRLNLPCIDAEFGKEVIKFRNKCCSKEVVIILDSYAIDVTNCYVYDLTPDSSDGLFKHTCTKSTKDLKTSQCCMENYNSLYQSLEKKKAVNLDYIVSDCKITMLLPTIIHNCSKVIVRIDYKTQSLRSPSLMWTLDQMQRPCVFTVGHQLNNRSLFPSQDMPQALSTWHCNVTLLGNDFKNFTVLTTGESAPIKLNVNDQVVYHSYNSLPMPAATFAIAIGEWFSTDLSPLLNIDIKENEQFLVPSCYLFSPACLHSKSVDQFSQYLPTCFQALHLLLGPYPLNYLTILIAPACFDSLGMACPHLLILSQSILCSNLTMLSRLAHELCHTWFGILTGPQDWTEEWLTEGVCCYLEDILHGQTMKWDHTEYQDRSNLRALLKYRLLTSEIRNTPEHLQTLRPHVLSEISVHSKEAQFVKNGLDPEKTVMQVHYLKGFFLLLYLEQKAGKEVFLLAIKTFINEKLGHLYSSKDFLHFIYNFCPSLRYDADVKMDYYNMK
ncbi:hypothetical protein Btru_062428 [Bulinus truncatus]|nr:hypothetical protein Btru_062428 [Bulinus truncatus]